MGRTVISKSDFDSVPSSNDGEIRYLGGRGNSKKGEPDQYTSRLIKYIPAEIISLYMTVDALIRSAKPVPDWIPWAIFIFGVFATYLYLLRIGKVYKQSQLLISVGAYCVWVFALGGPFASLAWYQPVYPGILLPIYTFSIALVDCKK